MLSLVCRHYPVTVDEAFKLTPRAAHRLAAAWGYERGQEMSALARMLGCTPKGDDDEAQGELADYDQTAVDKASAEHMRRLSEQAKKRG